MLERLLDNRQVSITKIKLIIITTIIIIMIMVMKVIMMIIITIITIYEHLLLTNFPCPILINDII